VVLERVLSTSRHRSVREKDEERGTRKWLT
jgi:hypothetical protein